MDPMGEMAVKSFYDADWARSPSYRSTTGFYTFTEEI